MRCPEFKLSYTFILHQTTTLAPFRKTALLLSYTFILHQTTTAALVFLKHEDCLIPLFYIKPQPQSVHPYTLPIVLYLYSTSNHNCARRLSTRRQIVLYLYSTSNHNINGACEFLAQLSYTFILHQTTTSMLKNSGRLNCLIPLFYIKPQRPGFSCSSESIVLYLYSTSNHNCGLCLN